MRVLEARVGWECCISKRGVRWARSSNGGIQAGGVRKGKHSVGGHGISKGSRNAAGGTAPGVTAA